MKTNILSRIMTFSLGMTVLGVAVASAAPTDEQKCKAAKIKEAGKYYSCRMKADAKAVKKAEPADFTKCDVKLLEKFAKIEGKFGSCPGTVEAFQSLGRRDSADMACRFAEGPPVRRCELPSSIVTVGFYAESGVIEPTLSVRNYTNLLEHARCFYLSFGCAVGPEFDIMIPLQGTLEWPALSGAGTALAVPTDPFDGELICVEVDAVGFPIGVNGLVAAVKDATTCGHDGDGLRDLGFNDANGTLSLLGAGSEYEACSVLRGRTESTPSLLATCADFASTSFVFDCP